MITRTAATESNSLAILSQYCRMVVTLNDIVASYTIFIKT